MGEDQRVVRGQGGELLGAVTKGLPVSAGDRARDALAEFGVRVESGADGGAAGGQFAEAAEHELQSARSASSWAT